MVQSWLECLCEVVFDFELARPFHAGVVCDNFSSDTQACVEHFGLALPQNTGHRVAGWRNVARTFACGVLGSNLSDCGKKRVLLANEGLRPLCYYRGAFRLVLMKGKRTLRQAG